MFKPFLITSMTAASVVLLMLLITPVAGGAGQVRAATPAGAALSAIGRDVVIDRPVEGSVQVLGGSVQVNEVIAGDLLVIGGNVVFGGRGRVNGSLIYGGGRVVGGSDRVGGRTQPLTTMEGAAASLKRNAVVMALLLAWLVAAVVLTLAGGREVRFSSVEIRADAMHCFALGLVAFTSFVLTAIMFSYLVPYFVGVPLLVALGVFGILTKVYGMVAVFHAVGTLVAGARTRDQLTGRRWLRGDLAMVVVGLLLLGAVRMVPMIGTIVWSAASIFGIGVALATRFGRREPWFLVWRPAEA